MTLEDDDDLARSILKLTLEDNIQHEEPPGSVFRSRSEDDDSRSTNATRAEAGRSLEIQHQASEIYQKLYLLDIEMHGRIRAVKDAVDQLDSADEQHVLLMVTTQYQWMKELQGELREMQLMAMFVMRSTGVWSLKRCRRSCQR